MISDKWFVISEDDFPTAEFKRDRLESARHGPLPDQHDLDAALTLLDAIAEWVEAWEDGDSGEGRYMTEDALRTLQIICARLGIEVDLTSALDMSRGRGRECDVWNMLGPVHDELLAYERDLLAREIEASGWPAVNSEIEALRTAWRNANSAQTYSSVGNHAVRVLEVLSDVVGGDEIPRDKTKNRLLSYMDKRSSGKANEDLKRTMAYAFDLAQGVKHDRDPDRLKTGAAASAAIMIVSMIRTASEPSKIGAEDLDDQSTSELVF